MNNIEASFEEQTATEEIMGDEFTVVDYETVMVRLFIHPIAIEQGFAEVGVRFNMSSDQFVGGYPTEYFKSSDIGNTGWSLVTTTDEFPVAGMGYIQHELLAGIFMTVRGWAQSPNIFKGWYTKSPLDPDFDEETQLVTTDLLTSQFIIGDSYSPGYYELEDGKRFQDLFAWVESDV